MRRTPRRARLRRLGTIRLVSLALLAACDDGSGTGGASTTGSGAAGGGESSGGGGESAGGAGGATGGSGGAVAWPDGEPAPESLYVTPSCSGPACGGLADWSRRDSGSFHCELGGVGVFTEAIFPDGYLTLIFPDPTALAFALPADASTHVDWSAGNFAAGFHFYPDTSMGTVALASCGTEIAGAFAVVDMVEDTTYGTASPWLVRLDGAFRCTVALGPVDCTQ